MEKDLAVLRIELVDVLPAETVSDIIKVINDLNFMFLWLKLASDNEENNLFPDYYTVKGNEILYTHRIDIGTPNIIELFGLAEPLIEVFKYIAFTVSGFYTSFKIIEKILEVGNKGLDIKLKKLDIENQIIKNSILESQKEIKASEKREIELKIKILELDYNNNLLEMAQKGYDEGKVSKDALNHKIEIDEQSKTIINIQFPSYVTNISIEKYIIK